MFGFSQGATMAYLTALRNPALVSGVLAVGGGLPEIDREGSLVHAADVERARAVRVFTARVRFSESFPETSLSSPPPIDQRSPRGSWFHCQTDFNLIRPSGPGAYLKSSLETTGSYT